MGFGAIAAVNVSHSLLGCDTLPRILPLMLKADSSYISSKIHGVTFHEAVSILEESNKMMITMVMAMMMMSIIIVVVVVVVMMMINNKLPVLALANAGPSCDPCGGPKNVIVQSKKKMG
jgi:hypothetical protein